MKLKYLLYMVAQELKSRIIYSYPGSLNNPKTSLTIVLGADVSKGPSCPV